MPDYVALKGTATQLLTQFGATATLTRTSGNTFDPAAGSYSGGSTTTLTGKGVRLNYSKSEIDGEMIQRDDFRMYFSADAGVPEIDDNLLFDSDNYRVMSVITISPSGADIMYELQIRR